MLAETSSKPFNNKNWIFETKYDGYRCITVIDQHVNLFSRNKLSFNDKFENIFIELKKISHKVILDGEIVIEDNVGRSNFQLLQQYQKTKKGIVKYYVFDILNLDGNDVTTFSLIKRKELLQLLLSKFPSEHIIFSPHIAEKGIDFYELAIKKNWEGIMAKDANSMYRIGKRTDEWQKIKILQQTETFIIGITLPKGARMYFGAIMLAQLEDNVLKYVGNCGTGFDDNTLKNLYQKFETYFTDISAVKEKVKIIGKIQWMLPHFVAIIKYAEMTADGHLRHPVFLGLKVEKVNLADTELSPKNDVKIDTSLESNTQHSIDLTIGKNIVHLTNQNKIYFPESNITKGELINYYNQIAEIILPYLINRPQSMNRFPNGINGQSFYHKDVDVSKIPNWLQTVKIYSDSNVKHIDYLLCNDKETLLYMGNLGCIELNPWNSAIQNIENPDWVVIDLDPEKDDFLEVVRTALMVKKVLDQLEIDCYCKTSGATGLHIYLPLEAKYTYETALIFAELIARRIVEKLPETTTILRNIKSRNHKIYIDYLQNRHGQTLASVYSVRPKPGATVSTPLEWNEVNDTLHPSQFTIKNTLKRLEKKGDLWKPVLKSGVDLNLVIKKIISEKNDSIK